MVANLINADCGTLSRTIESTRECGCEACKAWWCKNVPGYFHCVECGCVTLGSMVYSQMCEECFGDKIAEEGIESCECT